MGITKVTVQAHKCDNPSCGRLFWPIDGAVQPGITFEAWITLGGEPVNIIAWAHTFRCVGPAVRAVYDKELAKKGAPSGDKD